MLGLGPSIHALSCRHADGKTWILGTRPRMTVLDAEEPPWMPEIKTIGVAGSGTMGSGIAIVAARAGFRTIVYDTSAETVARARAQTETFFKRSVERGRLAADQLPVVMGRLAGTTTIGDLAACDLVIEAVFEDLAVKHALFAQLNAVCPPHTIFASNTSTLSI